ncbi:MAG: hypothetical protein ACFFDK_12960 [Promethearchaeota archaeon]
MQLYNVDENGDLIKIDKLDFNESDVYIVDDNKNIHIWVGHNTSQHKKDATANLARKLESEHGKETKILIMKQGREYGSFLVMMDNLKKGLLPGITIERRPELELEKPSEAIESETIQNIKDEIDPGIDKNIKGWLEQFNKYRKLEPIVIIPEKEEIGLEDQIREEAYYLSLENYDYNDLCWMLAEKILKYTMRMASIEDTKKKAEQVFRSSCTYDELCWLNAEMDLLIRKEYLKKGISLSDLY